jgi:hypothetical protein
MDGCMQKKFFLLGILVCLMSVPGVVGFSVSAVTINPAGELFNDTPVSVAFDVYGEDIELYDQLIITTDLKNPAWDTRLVTNGKDTPVISAFQDGNTLTIPGAVFNQRPGVKGTVHVQLDGIVPPESSSKYLLHTRHVDAGGTEYAYPSGFDLSMYVPPTPTPSPAPTEPAPVTTEQTTKVPSFGDLIAAEPTYPSFGDLIAAESETTPVFSSTPVPVPENRTLSVPASWAGEPPATASPLDPLVSIGAIGVILHAIQRLASRSRRS